MCGTCLGALVGELFAVLELRRMDAYTLVLVLVGHGWHVRLLRADAGGLDEVLGHGSAEAGRRLELDRPLLCGLFILR